MKYAKKLKTKRKRIVTYVPVQVYDNLIKLSKHKRISISEIINNQIKNN